MTVKNNERGFSYIEVIIAMMVVLVGFSALTSAVTWAFVNSSNMSQRLKAKEYAVSTLEPILSLRDMSTLSWRKIGNVGNMDVLCADEINPCGVFSNGVQPIKVLPGPDGQIGTTDDSFDPGADGIVGTDDDQGQPIPNFQREILITDICDQDSPSQSSQCIVNLPHYKGQNPTMMRRIEVNLYYTVNGIKEKETISTIVSNYLQSGD